VLERLLGAGGPRSRSSDSPGSQEPCLSRPKNSASAYRQQEQHLPLADDAVFCLVFDNLV